MTDFFLIKCKIERGAFEAERMFEIELSDNVVFGGESTGILVGTAHSDHLRDGERKPLDEDTPGYGEAIDGYVCCRKIRDLSDDWALVEVPSADVIHVAVNSLIPAD